MTRLRNREICPYVAFRVASQQPETRNIFKMQKFDFLIIGSGLGGLLCGNILAKEGFNVCIVEKNSRIGGSLQSFSRNNVIFNTGLNYTETLGEGQILNRYFRYFGLMDKLKIRCLDIDGFDRISFMNEGKEYRLAQGYENFVEILSNDFPGERKNLLNYIEKLKEISDSFSLYSLSEVKALNPSFDNMRISASDYLSSVTSNQHLQSVLAGNNILYAGVRDKTPLYIHSLISNSFINSAWRLVDGSSQLAEYLAESFIRHGGSLFTKSRITNFRIENNKIISAKLSNGEVFEAGNFISNIHPARTLEMIEPGKIKKVYRNRILNLKNTSGIFSVYVVLKKNSFRYFNHNIYHFATNNVWTTNCKQESWPCHFMLYTPAESSDNEFAKGAIILTYMSYDEVKKWENTTVGKRGEDYKNFKTEKAEKLLSFVETRIPGFSSHIEKYYTSTPLTWRNYTGTCAGSAYGILKDYKNLVKSFIMPRSKIPNLYFTGQNLSLHGILGVTIGSVITCGEFVGLKYLIKKVKKSLY